MWAAGWTLRASLSHLLWPAANPSFHNLAALARKWLHVNKGCISARWIAYCVLFVCSRNPSLSALIRPLVCPVNNNPADASVAVPAAKSATCSAAGDGSKQTLATAASSAAQRFSDVFYMGHKILVFFKLFS